MINAKFNSISFMRDMNNILDYSVGFLEGVHSGKTIFLKAVGMDTIELLKQYIDANARVNPAMLQHVYEWQQSGSPDSRLYNIDYTISNLGLSFKSTFSQSKSIKNGSTVPFYDKASIMENGIPVVIKPKKSVLAFEDNGETVFTSKPVVVANPGGNEAVGGFESTFDSFFNRYFSQAFLRASGIGAYLENPVLYKKNLPAGKRGGKATGIATGYRWIANAGVIG